MAENMEALKQNWFFRGYFNRRGFFDLDSVSLEDYRQGKVAPERDRKAPGFPHSSCLRAIRQAVKASRRPA